MLQTVLDFKALGTRWFIDLPTKNANLQQKILAKVSDFESKYSRFKNTSDLYKLNKTKVFNNPSREFINLVEYGLKMYTQTGGLFNMSVGARLEQDGYGQVTTVGAVISDDLVRDVLIKKDHIKLSDNTILDFGGFGKGWLVDELGQIIRSHGVSSFIINGGGDILVGDEPQEIVIEHPTKPDQVIKKVVLTRQALASSSALKRSWKDQNGVIKNHIINPLTDHKSNILSIHVMSQTCLLADTLATVLLIASSAQKQTLIQKFPILIYKVS